MMGRASGLLRHAAPGIAMGLAGAGIMGFLGSKGDPAGVPAGLGGVFSGGPSGLFSGGVLGTIAGVASIGLAGHHAGFRTGLAKGVTSVLQSKPVQNMAARVMSAAPSQLPGAAARQGAFGMLQSFGRLPQHTAMTHLHDYLVKKQARRYAMGAVMGGMAGAVAGAPLGAMRRAYVAGSEV